MAAGLKGLAEREKMKTGDKAAITEMEVLINGFLFMYISNSICVMCIFDENIMFVSYFVVIVYIYGFKCLLVCTYE
jgi:hypothetical protein